MDDLAIREYVTGQRLGALWSTPPLQSFVVLYILLLLKSSHRLYNIFRHHDNLAICKTGFVFRLDAC